MKQLFCWLRPLAGAVSFLLCLSGAAQRPAVRLAGPITGHATTVLPGTRPPRALASADVGAVPAEMPVKGITLVFNRSAAQQAALETLLEAQQNPSSPLYHQWLTPDQFAAQFGVSDADIATVETWLAAQGFTVNSVARSRNRITFSGTAGQVAKAFGTELHHYRIGSETHFAPSTDLSLPAELAPLVSSVQHLSDFRPKPQFRPMTVRPDYTSSLTQNHFLTPLDVATMYDVTPEYNSGFDGTGQTIAIAGQSYIQAIDVQRFQTAAGLPSNLPNLVLVPNSGGSAIYEGDESESDLDVEYSAGMARGATIDLVYVGNNLNYSVFDGMTYAVTEDIAPVISVSYGDCEVAFSTSELNTLNGTAQQASAQGQTIVAASGDNGSTTCFGDTDLSANQQEVPSVDVPADLPNVTGIGGLQMAAGTFTATNTTYFAAATGSDNISSLLSYVPEVVWNEDSTTQGIASGGGGASTVYPRPTWQTGVPGIPSGTFRLVPDLALQASIDSPGYLYCSSDPSVLGSGQTSSCTSGFRDASSTLLTVAGGTSFATPIMAGLLAILNQVKHTTGQGNVNPVLYSLASNPTTYSSAFHDINSGSNACSAGAGFCSTAGAAVYTATAGFDEASGLGSIDFAHLVSAWPSGSASSLSATTTTLSPATLTPNSGGSDVVTITVASAAGTPSGTVVVTVDGGPSNGGLASTTLTLTNGQATYTYPGTTTGGSHVITATYSGSATYAPSTGSTSLTLAGSAVPSGSFKVTATGVTFPSGSTATSTVTVVPSSGYNGTVNFTVTGLPSTACYSIGPLTISGNSSETLTIGAGSACTGTAALTGAGGAAATATGTRAMRGPAPKGPWDRSPVSTALAGLMGAGLLFGVRRWRLKGRLPSLLAIAILSVAAGLGLSGCGGSTAVNTPVNTPTAPVTYTVSVVGTDSITSSITASATVAVTVNP